MAWSGEMPHVDPAVGSYVIDAMGNLVFVPAPGELAAVTDGDDFQDLSGDRENLRKTRRCGLCGGTYNETVMVRIRGKWYCTVNECAEEAGQ